MRFPINVLFLIHACILHYCECILYIRSIVESYPCFQVAEKVQPQLIAMYASM